MVIYIPRNNPDDPPRIRIQYTKPSSLKLIRIRIQIIKTNCLGMKYWRTVLTTSYYLDINDINSKGDLLREVRSTIKSKRKTRLEEFRRRKNLYLR